MTIIFALTGLLLVVLFIAAAVSGYALGYVRGIRYADRLVRRRLVIGGNPE